MIRGLTAAGLLLAVCACGKVADPLPPFVRVPVPVTDLAVEQRANSLILRWTNPARNIDGSSEMDLARVLVLNGPATMIAVEAGASGLAQTWTLDAGNLIGQEVSFQVRLETRRGRLSELSPVVTIVPVDTPGPVRNLRALVDRRRVRLEWLAAEGTPADGFQVYRDDQLLTAEPVAEATLSDTGYRDSATHVYRVLALRRSGTNWIPGGEAAALTVQSVDRTAPAAINEIEAVTSDAGTFLTWPLSDEEDLDSYRLWKSESEDGPLTVVIERLQTNGFFDRTWRPGLYYAVSAIDRSGNMSLPGRRTRVP